MTLIGFSQNRHAVGCPLADWGHTDKSIAGVLQGLHHHLLHVLDGLNPPPRPIGAGTFVRTAVGVPGRGCWKKRTPLCNGADRGWNITPLREQADFQRVVHYQTTRRTNEGGESK